jgi:hypothetical protein
VRLEAAQIVEAPPEVVFHRLADFEMFEDRAARRGMPVKRLTADPPAWRIGVDWRGLLHEVDLMVHDIAAPRGYVARVATRGIDGDAAVEIAPRDPGSLLSVALRLDGQGFAGRMLLQTVNFARPMLEGRLKGALARLAAEIETGQER